MHNKDVKKITIFGGPFSGKTTFSVKLAMSLAEQRKDVVILSGDYFTPASGLLSKTFDDKKSLGNIIKEEAITEEKIIANLIPIYRKGRIALLSYALYENALSFRETSKKDIENIFNILSGITDFVIVDTMSIFYADKVSSHALLSSDLNIGIYDTSLKNYTNYISNKDLIEKNVKGKSIYLLSKAMDKSQEKSSKKLYEKIDFTLPFVREINEQFEDKNLFRNISGKKYREYESVIDEIVEVV